MLLPNTAFVINCDHLNALSATQTLFVSDSGQALLLMTHTLLPQTPVVSDSEPLLLVNSHSFSL